MSYRIVILINQSDYDLSALTSFEFTDIQEVKRVLTWLGYKGVLATYESNGEVIRSDFIPPEDEFPFPFK